MQNFFLLLNIELKEAGSATIGIIILGWLAIGISVLRRVSLLSVSTLRTVSVAVIRLLLHVHPRGVVAPLETIEFDSSFVLVVGLSVSHVLAVLSRLLLLVLITLIRGCSVIIEVKGCGLIGLSRICCHGLGLICLDWLVLVIVFEDFVLGRSHRVPARWRSHVLRLGSGPSYRIGLLHSWGASRH